jgi:dihydroneopterin aldolase
MLKILTINKILLGVHLGCSEQERSKPQSVEISVRIAFRGTLKALHSDDLTDTFCYDKMVQHFERVLKEQEFNLVERLAFFLFNSLKSQLPAKARLQIDVNKVSPPIASIRGGVIFSYGDPL